MAENRKIKKVFRSRPTIEGAGVHLKRAFGFGEVPQFDPFLLLDDFHSNDPKHYSKGFPWHPHRGIETITYVLHGSVDHGDSMGNKGVIESGDVQWMTAGSGVIHQEMPRGDGNKLLWGFQLWANLPAKDKMMDPRYREVQADTIPEAVLDGGVLVKVICGQIAGTKGPVEDIVTQPEYLDVTVPPGMEFTHAIPKGRTAFAYVIGGRGLFCQERDPFSYEMTGANWSDLERGPFIEAETLVLFEDGDQITVTTEDQGARFLLVSGKPLGEPVAWYGPIVMNTKEELEQAFAEFNDGSFIKKK
jgi:redox-sensitive bicupin YhaK (pirin superfamily)